MLTPGARTVTAALRVMGLAMERHFTNYHRVLNRATWSARQGSRILLGLLITLLVPPGATIVLERTTRWNAVAAVRSRRKAATETRYAPQRSMSSAVSA